MIPAGHLVESLAMALLGFVFAGVWFAVAAWCFWIAWKRHGRK